MRLVRHLLRNAKGREQPHVRLFSLEAFLNVRQKLCKNHECPGLHEPPASSRESRIARAHEDPEFSVTIPACCRCLGCSMGRV